MNEKILCVDDDPNVLAGFQRNLRRRFCLETALNAEDSLNLLGRQGPYAAVVVDMHLPGMDGIQLLSKIRQQAPETVRIMLTGNADQRVAVDAVNRGHIFRFLNKPCPPETLALALEAALEQYRLITAEKELLEKTLSGSVKMLTDILSMVEPQIFGRAQMLREYARKLAAPLGIAASWELEVAALLSHIAYVTIPATIMQKERTGAALSPPEKQVLARIPEIGQKLLLNIPRLEAVARIVLYQTKYYDGSGFPHDAVAGDQIPLGARVLRVLSDLIKQEIEGSHRGEILDQMRRRPGAYDPKVLDAAVATLGQDSESAKSSQAILARELAPGQVLLSPVATNDGVLIVPAGTEVSQMLIEKLKNFAAFSGIKEPIYVMK
ncbi:MAG: response regulator [Verrucomicrobia bacterium]|nr:response regulator [Verrucomicrobiota bacterium]